MDLHHTVTLQTHINIVIHTRTLYKTWHWYSRVDNTCFTLVYPTTYLPYFSHCPGCMDLPHTITTTIKTRINKVQLVAPVGILKNKKKLKKYIWPCIYMMMTLTLPWHQ